MYFSLCLCEWGFNIELCLQMFDDRSDHACVNMWYLKIFYMPQDGNTLRPINQLVHNTPVIWLGSLRIRPSQFFSLAVSFSGAIMFLLEFHKMPFSVQTYRASCFSYCMCTSLLYIFGSIRTRSSAIFPSSYMWTVSSMSACMNAPGISIVATSQFSIASITHDQSTDLIATVASVFLVCVCSLFYSNTVCTALSFDGSISFLFEKH